MFELFLRRLSKIAYRRAKKPLAKSPYRWYPVKKDLTLHGQGTGGAVIKELTYIYDMQTLSPMNYEDITLQEHVLNNALFSQVRALYMLETIDWTKTRLDETILD